MSTLSTYLLIWCVANESRRVQAPVCNVRCVLKEILIVSNIWRVLYFITDYLLWKCNIVYFNILDLILDMSTILKLMIILLFFNIFLQYIELKLAQGIVVFFCSHYQNYKYSDGKKSHCVFLICDFCTYFTIVFKSESSLFLDSDIKLSQANIIGVCNIIILLFFAPVIVYVTSRCDFCFLLVYGTRVICYPQIMFRIFYHEDNHITQENRYLKLVYFAYLQSFMSYGVIF
jgi:hypothetical protein